MYGCPYELFKHLNPAKLEPWRKARELETKNKAEMIDYAAWRFGIYTTHAYGVWLGKNHSYPERPIGQEERDDRVPPPGKGEAMTDGARFAAFAAAHRRSLREKKEKVDSRGIG